VGVEGVDKVDVVVINAAAAFLSSFIASSPFPRSLEGIPGCSSEED